MAPGLLSAGWFVPRSTMRSNLCAHYFVEGNERPLCNHPSRGAPRFAGEHPAKPQTTERFCKECSRRFARLMTQPTTEESA